MRSTVQRRVGSSAQITSADLTAIIADVHRDVAVHAQWSERRREALVVTAGPYTTGTVAVTQGSSTVAGTGTAWTAAMVGRAIAISGESSYFWVQAVGGATSLTLGDAQGTVRNWSGASATSQSYRIFQHQYALPSNVAIVLAGIRNFRLRERTRNHFDWKDPLRTSSGQPIEYALVRNNIAGTPPVESVFIEFWPVPDGIYEQRIPFLIEPPDLSADTDLPVCPSEPIEWRAAAEAAWFIYTKTGDARWDALGKSYYQVYAGDESQGVPGVLLQALRDDQQRFGLPQTLTDGEVYVGNDFLSQRDWDVFSG